MTHTLSSVSLLPDFRPIDTLLLSASRAERASDTCSEEGEGNSFFEEKSDHGQKAGRASALRRSAEAKASFSDSDTDRRLQLK